MRSPPPAAGARLTRQVWTTLAWLRDGFRASGVHVPIHVVPLGMDAKPALNLTKERNATFNFLTVANIQERKGLVELAIVPPPPRPAR
jgi:hypothetical protein